MVHIRYVFNVSKMSVVSERSVGCENVCVMNILHVGIIYKCVHMYERKASNIATITIP